MRPLLAMGAAFMIASMIVAMYSAPDSVRIRILKTGRPPLKLSVAQVLTTTPLIVCLLMSMIIGTAPKLSTNFLKYFASDRKYSL